MKRSSAPTPQTGNPTDKCPTCGGKLVSGVDQYEDAYICPACNCEFSLRELKHAAMGSPSIPTPSVEAEANRESAAWPTSLRDIVDAFIEHAQPLAEFSGTQWADDNDLSQPCHWLNETIKEARAFMAALPTPPTPKEDAQAAKGLPVEELPSADAKDSAGMRPCDA